MIRRVMIVLVVAGLLLGGLWLSQQRAPPAKVSGFVESDEIRIGSRVGGRVAKVLVEEGSEVRRGDPLVELEPFQLLELKAQAESELAQARAEYDRLQAGYRPEEIAQSEAREDQLIAARDRLADGEEDIVAAQAALDLANSQFELARLKFERTERLFARNSASQADMDEATADYRVSRATVRVREEELAKLKRVRPKELKEADARREEARQEVLLRRQGYRQEDRLKAEAAMLAAQAGLAAIDRQIEELTIRAPADGAVEAVDLRPGDLVGANTPAISMIEAGRLWVRAYVPENRLDVRVGRELPITVDSFPDRKFKGRVSFVARQAEFTPGNVQTPEERSKQVFRIKVVIDEGLDVLRPGMAADLWLDQ
ncbi:MAG: HlyD family secretion protein [Planctomycetaceae bacterium]